MKNQNSQNSTPVIWNGDASLANEIFGESYGLDWAYASKESSDVIVKDRLIKVGETV